MKHPDVILSLEAELSGLEQEIEGCKDGIFAPLMVTREVAIIADHLTKCEKLAKQYKSAIRALTLLDEIT